MAIRPRVELRFHDVIPCEDSTQPVEFAVCLTEKVRLVFSLKRYDTGWFVCTASDDGGVEPMHDKSFDTMTEAHHAGSQVVIEGIPKLVRELTKRLAMREGVYE